MRIITEKDIIAARQRVAEAEKAGQQQDFEDALLASSDIQPEHVTTWIENSVLQVHWCACPRTDRTPLIVCPDCGLPPYWVYTGEDNV